MALYKLTLSFLRCQSGALKKKKHTQKRHLVLQWNEKRQVTGFVILISHHRLSCENLSIYIYGLCLLSLSVFVCLLRNYSHSFHPNRPKVFVSTQHPPESKLWASTNFTIFFFFFFFFFFFTIFKQKFKRTSQLVPHVDNRVLSIYTPHNGLHTVNKFG